MIGVDEVGRGPLAGPVTVAAFFIDKKHRTDFLKGMPSFRDSKKLSKLQRAVWMRHIRVCKKRGWCYYRIASVSPRIIDRIGIVPSIRSAIMRVLASFDAATPVVLDGGLSAPARFIRQKTIIKGDEKELVIACASIIAKEYRDAYMKRVAQAYPRYGFDTHVGYGTKAHYRAIERYGPTPLHRYSFLPRKKSR